MNNDHGHNHQGNGGFTNGLVLGVILGVAIALLFTTKRGKKLIKVLTEEGLDKLSGIEDILEDVMEEEEDGDEEEVLPVVEAKPVKEKSAKIVARPAHHDHEEIKEVVVETKPVDSKGYTAPVQTVTTTTRRFFRGVPRRN